MNFRTFGLLCLIAAILLIGAVAYHNSQKSSVPIVFSPKDMLGAIWGKYKDRYIEQPSGRTVDHQHDDISTSEGESYSMLRAVWMDDQTAFDQSWQWTNKYLGRSDNHLFSWLYGKRPDGTWGVRADIGGQNSASDADTDIALALVFAYGRWQNPAYLAAAKQIIPDIWNNEVIQVGSMPYLSANNVEKTSGASTFVANPSYFAPYAYRIFARLDPAHPWQKLVDSSYQILNASMDNKLGKNLSNGLPPDWILVDRATAAVSAGTGNNLSSNYSFDAMRVPWRLAIDWQWNQDPRARDTLNKMNFLKNQWRTTGVLYAGYSHDGQLVNDFQAPAMYGGSIGYFLVADVQDANAIYDAKLRSLYNPDTDSWKQPLSYYDDNWAWFGLAMYHNFLPDLSTTAAAGLGRRPLPSWQ